MAGGMQKVSLLCALAILVLLLPAPHGSAALPAYQAIGAESSPCAVRLDGSADCWGFGDQTVRHFAGPYTQVAVEGHGCGLTPDGAADCWGANRLGQATDTTGPFVDIRLGIKVTCGLTEISAVVCWGDDSYGVVSHPGPFTQFDVGAWHACGLTPEGDIKCWSAISDARARDHAGPFFEVTADAFHTCGLRPSGVARCWGIRHLGASSNAGPFTQIDAGYRHTCGVTPEGDAVCWGFNGYGEGDSASGPFDRVVAGANANCGLTKGALFCWGADGSDGRGRLLTRRLRPAGDDVLIHGRLWSMDPDCIAGMGVQLLQHPGDVVLNTTTTGPRGGYSFLLSTGEHRRIGTSFPGASECPAAASRGTTAIGHQ